MSDYLPPPPHLPTSSIAITQITVITMAVATKIAHWDQVAPTAVKDIPAAVKPDITTCVQIIPMTMPKAVPSDVAMVLFISLMLIGGFSFLPPFPPPKMFRVP